MFGGTLAPVRRIPALTNILGALALCASTTASAQPKRDIPDYDGRGNPDADQESALVWIPRVILAPVYVANEYLLRRPIGWLIRHAEAGHWVDSVESIFEFGPDGEDLLIPTFLFDFGLLPSVGLYFAADHFLAHDNSLHLHGATWGPKWLDFTAADRYLIDKTDSLQVRGEYKRSEDNLYFGIGPDVIKGTQSRYGLARIEGSVAYHRIISHESWLGLEGGMHHIGFVDGDCCGNPSVDQQIADGVYTMPPGYRDDYTTAFLRAGLALDSRSPRPAPGSGVYLDAHANANFDIHAPRSWIEYGGAIGASADITGHQRTIKIQLALDFIDSMQGGSIPFTEYPVLTDVFMPGFLDGWMRGLSTAAAQVGYTWPVWQWLDGQVRFSAGNAFGYHLAGLVPGNFRFSGDIGVTTSGARDAGFEILFGLGTQTIDQGAGITSVRITFGSRREF